MSTQGKWILKNDKGKLPNGTEVEIIDKGNLKCSICGGRAGLYVNLLVRETLHLLRYPYCPWCGRKMRNGINKEENKL